MMEWLDGLSQNIKASVIVIIALMILLSIVGKKVGNLSPRDKPRGVAFIAVIFVDTINDFIKQFYGKEWRRFAPMLTAIFLYLIFANTAGLFGLATPLANMSVALSMSLFAFLTIQGSGLLVRGPLNRLKDLSSPTPLLLPLNIVSEISTPVAMGLRLFGNLLTGSVIFVFVYNLLPSFAATFFTATIVHPIFNVGFGVVQAMVYFMLLTIFVSMAIEDANIDSEKSS